MDKKELESFLLSLSKNTAYNHIYIEFHPNGKISKVEIKK
jgi:hypothetical protein